MMEISKNRSCSLRLAGMLLLGFLCAIVLAPSATADTVYTYTGNPFTEFQGTDACIGGVGECSITLSFTLAFPLPANFGSGFLTLVTPLSFSMTDGVHTLTQLNSTPFFLVETGPTGQIDFWGISASTPLVPPEQFFLVTQRTASVVFGDDDTNTFTAVGNGDFNSTGFARVLDNPGTWTISTVPHVPEPSSLMLLSAGLLGLTPTFRKKR